MFQVKFPAPQFRQSGTNTDNSFHVNERHSWRWQTTPVLYDDVATCRMAPHSGNYIRAHAHTHITVLWQASVCTCAITQSESQRDHHGRKSTAQDELVSHSTWRWNWHHDARSLVPKPHKFLHRSSPCSTVTEKFSTALRVCLSSQINESGWEVSCIFI